MLVAGLAVFLAACGEAAPPVEARPESTADPPIISITSPDTGDIAFVQIGSVLIGPDSQVVLSESPSRRFLVYAQDGRLLHVVGRAGSGPGELPFPSSHGLRGDSLWIYDAVAKRITVFSLRTGALVGTVPAPLTMPGWRGSARVLSLLEQGAMLVEGEHSVTRLAGDPGLSVVPFGIRARSGAFTPVGARDLGSSAFQAPGMVGLQPFITTPRLAVDPGGTRFALVAPAEAATTVTMYDASGGTIYRVELALAGDPLTPARVDSAFRQLGPGFAALDPQVIRTPARLPPLSRAVLGTDGALWLTLDSPWLSRPILRWVVLDPAGTAADTVHIPASREVVHADAGSYWAVVRDSLDVPSVHRYRRSRAPR